MERASLVPSIKSIEQGTWMPKVPVETLFETYIDPTDPSVNDFAGFRIAHDLWDMAKEDRNALIAIWTGEMWKLSRGQRESAPDGIEYGTYMQKKRYTQGVLDTALFSLNTARTSRLHTDSMKWNALDQAYHYYLTLIAFGARHNMTGGDTADSFISRGVGTASNLLWGSMALAHRYCEENDLSTDPSYLIPIIEQSYGTFSPFIHMHKEISATIINQLYQDIQHDELNPDYFHFAPHENSYKITLNRSMVYGIQLDGGLPALEHTPRSVTTGCPASYAKDTDDPETPERLQKTVIRSYFEWSMHLAFPTHYTTSQRYQAL